MNNKFKTLITFFVLCFLTPSFADNGVIEINNICATQLASGCFSGDAIGYPITIDGSVGRSYRLTSDLIIPDENTHGIDIISSNISLDLNGFSIVRSGCENSTTSCILAGTGIGVRVRSSPDYFGISIKNGSVIGMGNTGLSIASDQNQLSNLQVRWNGEDGINTKTASVFNNIVFQNGRHGVVVSSKSIVRNNVIANNLNIGILAFDSSNINNNTVNDNVGIGLSFNGTLNSIYRNNVITNTGVSSLVFGGINMGGNSCNTIVCPL